MIIATRVAVIRSVDLLLLLSIVRRQGGMTIVFLIATLSNMKCAINMVTTIAVPIHHHSLWCTNSMMNFKLKTRYLI